MKKFLKVVSIVMVFALFVQIMPMSTIADAVTATGNQAETSATEKTIVGECKNYRDKYTKVFEKTDGTFTAVVSASPLHFEENSKWKDIDNTLVESTVDGKAILKNTDNSFSVALPKSISDTDKTVKIEKDGYKLSFTLNDYEASVLRSHIDAKTEKVTADSDITDVQKAAKLDEKSSTVKYDTIKSGVSFEYTVLPDSVKENIVLDSKPDNNTNFSFTISAPNMTAKLLKDNSIEFYGKDDKTAVFTLPAPFMYDTNNVFSKNIEVNFVKTGNEIYTLSYTPSAEWLNDRSRSYPVVIDPIVRFDSNNTIYDSFISNATAKQDVNYGDFTYATVGNKSDGAYWTYIQPDSCLWSSKAIVTNATLKVYAKSETAQDMTIAASVVTEGWVESGSTYGITYVNRPENESLPIDCAIAPASEYTQISFDITQAVPQIYDANGQSIGQFGVVLSAYDTSTNSANIYTSEYTNTQYVPVIEYSFVETTGLSDKYEYHTQEVGRAGTVSVNDFTGGMYIERNELGIDGKIMPVNIKQYFSTATVDLMHNINTTYFYSSFGNYGRIWLTNYNQYVGIVENYYSDENGNDIDLYFYLDDTGSITYFEQTETIVDGMEKWAEQFDKTSTGKGLIMWVPESGYETNGTFEGTEVEKDSGEKLAFDSYGRLTTLTSAPIENSTATLPTIQICYDEEAVFLNEIDYILDGVGRKYDMTYDTEGCLTSIQAFDAQNNAITVGTGSSVENLEMTYSYDYDLRLTAAEYPDGETVEYTYVGTSDAPLIESATDINGYRMQYEYNGKSAVTQITESTLNSSSTRVTGNVIDITYGSPYQRTYEDSYGNIESAQFDNYGRKVGTYNEESRYQGSTYEDTEIDGKTYSLSADSSYVEEQNDNLLLNSGFESGSSNWTIGQGSSYSPGVDSTVKYTGTNSYKMHTTARDTIYIVQSFSNLTPGKYTLSANVRVPQPVNSIDKGAELSLKTKDSGGTTVEQLNSSYVKTTGHNWKRLSVSIDVTSSTPTLNVYLWLYNSTGTAYFDNAKLERSDLETPYNLLLNNKMTGVTNNLPNNWTVNNLSSGDIVSQQTKSGATVNAMGIAGNLSTDKSISQTFNVPASKGDTVDFGCWAKATARSSINYSDAAFRLRVVYNSSPTTQVTETQDFIPYHENWQFAAVSVTLEADCTSITVYLDYGKQINTAYFTDARVYYEAREKTFCVCGDNCFIGDGCLCDCTSEQDCDCTQCDTGLCICGSNCAQGIGCTCTCASEQECNCMECKGSCICGTECAFGDGCPCTCASEQVCDCPQCETGTCVCGDDCYYGFGCTCTCTSEETCTCAQCSGLCVCGENCVYGQGCDCDCTSEQTCTCLKCQEETTYTYDSLGNILTTTVPNGVKEMVTGSTYSTDKNYLTGSTNSAGNVVEYNYNLSNGTLTSVTTSFGDNEDTTVNYTYNSMRALANVTQSVTGLSTGTEITNSYNYENDRLDSISTGNDVDYSFEYDLWGNQTGVNVGTQNLAEYTYGTDENRSRVSSLAFGNGQTITYNYDSQNNVTGISYDDGTTWSYNYTYSSANGLTSVTDNISNQITYFTDEGYEIYTIPQTGDGELLYSSSYNNDGNFVQTANGYTFTFDDGTAETTAEAETRRTTGLTVNRSTISSTGTSLALSTTTDFFNRTTNSSITVKNGSSDLGSVAVDYSYHNHNNIADRTTGFVSNYKNVVSPTTGTATNVEYTYTYDASGNITSDSLGDTLKHSYVYDEAGQLVRVNDAVQNKTFCYTYDNGGNLIYKKRYAYTTGTLGSVLQTMATYTYGDSNWKDKLTQFNNALFYYDNIGNLTSYNGISFTWSAGRQLEKYEISLDDYCIEYTYNADGLRTQRKIIDDGNADYYYYDYIWADGNLVSQTDGTNVLYFLYDDSNSPIGFVLNDSATYLYIKNLQGDITGIADENGAIIVNYSYDEWGKLLSLTGSEADTIGLLNPLRYRGYYYDNETGYYYLQSRYYNPLWCRFINADSIVNGSNLFAYCGNNPINATDPSGFWYANNNNDYSCDGHEEMTRKAYIAVYSDKTSDPQVKDIVSANKYADAAFAESPLHSRTGISSDVKVDKPDLQNLIICLYNFAFPNGKNAADLRSALDKCYKDINLNDTKTKKSIVTDSNKNQRERIINFLGNPARDNSKNASLKTISTKEAALGMVLHCLQDYFSHYVPAVNNGIYYEHVQTAFGATKTDDSTVLLWRGYHAGLVSEDLLNMYKAGKTMSKVEFKNCKHFFCTILPGENWVRSGYIYLS